MSTSKTAKNAHTPKTFLSLEEIRESANTNRRIAEVNVPSLGGWVRCQEQNALIQSECLDVLNSDDSTYVEKLDRLASLICSYMVEPILSKEDLLSLGFSLRKLRTILGEISDGFNEKND